MLVAHANDWLGYLLEPDDFASGGYESCLSFHGDRRGAAVRRCRGAAARPARPGARAGALTPRARALSDPR